MIVPVSANGSGPFEFLLDTGTQITTVDPSLAVELCLTNKRAEEVAGIGFQAAAYTAHLDLLESGSHAVANQKVLVYDLQSLQSNGLSIRGVLGEDFLEHFDILIDNAHGLLCLDDSSAMRASVKGTHIALSTLDNTPGGAPLPRSLIVKFHLSDAMRPVHLWLDSGTNFSFLYNPFEYPPRRTSPDAPQRSIGKDGAERVYVALPAQDLKIGSLELPKVSLFTLAGTRGDSGTRDFDGVLTMGLFRRIFICHADHFVVLEAR